MHGLGDNWGTLHATQRRVSLPLVVDPEAAPFRCPIHECVITPSSCGNRHHVAKTTPNPERRLQLGACVGCRVGAANLAGKPFAGPLRELVEARKHKEDRMPEGKWKDRTCARDRTTVFTPKSVQQKVCGTCEPCRQAASKERKPSKVNGQAGKPPGDRPAKAAPTGIDGARQLLESLGYPVIAIATPKGPRLIVGGA